MRVLANLNSIAGNRNKQEIDKIIKNFKKAGIAIQSVPRFGTRGDDLFITIVCEYPNKREAYTADISSMLKILNKMYDNVSLDTSSESYPGGKAVQSSDWRKDSDSDPHELYVAFTGKL